MGGDGVSMPTVLSQLGNVAKTLARNQQAAATSTGSMAPPDKEELQDLKKIPEAERPENRTLGRKRKDSKHRGRDGQEQDEHVMDASPQESEDEQQEMTGTEPSLGNFIDRKA